MAVSAKVKEDVAVELAVAITHLRARLRAEAGANATGLSSSQLSILRRLSYRCEKSLPSLGRRHCWRERWSTHPALFARYPTLSAASKLAFWMMTCAAGMARRESGSASTCAMLPSAD